MDKQLKSVLSVMSRYFFRPRNYPSLMEARDIKLNSLLDIKKRKGNKIPDFIGVQLNSQENKDRWKVFNYFYKLGKDDEFISNEWFNVRKQRTSTKENYDTMPKPERKDNQNPVTNTLNYGSGSCGGYTSIRVPSKKRKNKMKNFKKLFNK